jgi:hypothetical protein
MHMTPTQLSVESRTRVWTMTSRQRKQKPKMMGLGSNIRFQYIPILSPLGISTTA